MPNDIELYCFTVYINLVQASLPVVDNNRKVVGALSVVGEAPPQNKNGCWKQ